MVQLDCLRYHTGGGGGRGGGGEGEGRGGGFLRGGMDIFSGTMHCINIP